MPALGRRANPEVNPAADNPCASLGSSPEEKRAGHQDKPCSPPASGTD